LSDRRLLSSRCQQALRFAAMSFLGISLLLESVLNDDGSIHDVLAIHSLHGSIASFKLAVLDKSISLGFSGVRISHDMWGLNDETECAKGIV